jgi:hypothetical protein
LAAAGFGFGLVPAVVAAEDGFLTGGDVVCGFAFDTDDLLAVVFDAADVFIGCDVVVGFGFAVDEFLTVVFAAAAFFGVGFGFVAVVVFTGPAFLTALTGMIVFGFVVWAKAVKDASPNSVITPKNLIKTRRRYQNNITKLPFSPASRILAL